MIDPRRSACRYACRVIGVGLLLSPWVGAQPAGKEVTPPAAEPTHSATQGASTSYAVKIPANVGTRKTISPAERNLARSYAAAAFTFLDTGAYQQAVDEFGRAIALLDVPTLLVGRADALVHLGKWKEATLDYEAALAYQLAPGDSESFANSQRDAATKLSALRARMPRLRIDSKTRQVTITVDAQPSAALDTTTTLGLDPGPHTVVIAALGQSVVHTFDAKEHELLSLEGPKPPPLAASTLVVQPGPSKPSTATAESAPPKSEAPSTEVIVSGAVTGALVIGAIVTGVMFWTSRSHYDDIQEDNNTSDDEARNQYDRTKTIALVNTTLTAAAVAAAGVTTYFWVAPQFSDANPTPGNANLPTPLLSGVAAGLSSRF